MLKTLQCRGQSCTTKAVTDGIEVTCPGSEPVTIKNGTNGASGKSCTVSENKEIDGYDVICDNIKVGELRNGAAGKSAYQLANTDKTLEQWLASLKGEKGDGCTIEAVTGGAKITCEDGTSVTLKDGAKGQDGKSFVDGWMVDPRDKQLYRTVTIYNPDRDYYRVWMAENLNYATEVTGTDSSSFCYGDNGSTDRGTANCAKYGRLYTWAAAVGKSEAECGYGENCDFGSSEYLQGVCPEGWHLPFKHEWEKLIVAADGNIYEYANENVAGKALKSTDGWNSSGNGTDAFGFAALPAGLRSYNGSFNYDGYDAFFWSSTEDNSNDAYYMYLGYRDDDAYLGYRSKGNGFSVRCVKN